MTQTYQTEAKTLLKYAMPLFLTGLSQSLFAFFDGVVIGQALGTRGIGAISVANSLFFVLIFLGIGASTVLSPMLVRAKLHANNAPAMSAQVFRRGLALHAFLGLLIAYVIWLCLPHLSILKKSPELIIEAQNYLSIRLFCAFTLMLFVSLKRLAEAYLAFYKIALAVVLSQGLHLFLLYTWVADYGIQSAAWATLLSQVVEDVVLLFLLLQNKDIRQVLAYLFQKLPKLENIDVRLQKVWQTALPSGVYGFLEAGLFYLVTFICLEVSADAVAAHYIIMHIMAFVFKGINAIGVASSLRMAKHFQENNKTLLTQTLKTALGLCAVFLTIFACLLFPFGESWVYFFAKKKENTDMLALAYQVLPWAFALKWIDTVQMQFNAGLKAMQKTFYTPFVGFFAYILLALPLANFLAPKYGLLGIYQSLMLGMALVALGFGLVFRWQKNTCL